MATIYLERHTVEFTPELWAFCTKEAEERYKVPPTEMVDVVYDTLEFRSIPSKMVSRAVVRVARVDATHVRMTIDVYFTKQVRNGRTAGWRSWVTADLMDASDKPAATVGEYFDLKGNLMRQGHVRAEETGLNIEVADITQNVIYAFYFIQKVLRTNPDDLEEHEEELPVREVRHVSSNKKRKQSTAAVATTRTYRTYRLKKDFDFTERNPIVRTCRLWYVRGHDRHLRDGRVVHIAPHYKGVDRALARPEDGDYGRLIKVRPTV